jgi:hypothetical protein
MSSGPGGVDHIDVLRGRLATELHDGVQQTLTVVCMELEAAQAGLMPVDAAVTRSLVLVREAFAELGQLVEALRGGENGEVFRSGGVGEGDGPEGTGGATALGERGER